MTTLVEQGIVGLIALCVFLAVPAMAAARRARATGDDAYAALAAALAALAVVMTVDTAMLHGPSFAMMMLTAGLAATASTGDSRHRVRAEWCDSVMSSSRSDALARSRLLHHWGAQVRYDSARCVSR